MCSRFANPWAWVVVNSYSFKTKWMRPLTLTGASTVTVNQWLNIIYGVALLSLSFRLGLSVTVAALSAALIALRFSSQISGQRVPARAKWATYLSYLFLLVEFFLLMVLSCSVGSEGSSTLFLIYTATVMLNYPAYFAFPFVFIGYLHYLMFIDNQAFGVSTYLLSFINFSVVPLSLFGIRLLIRQRQQIMTLNARLESQAALATEMTRLRERNSLAEAVHDTVGHTLTASIVSLEGATVLLHHRPTEAAALLDTVRGQLQTGLGDIRQTVRTLRTDTLADDTTLQESLVQLVERVRRQTPVNLELQQRFTAELLPIQAYVLYSVVREGITNALKHARATHIQITLEETAQQCIALTVCDNGVGTPAPVPGFGLIHLKQKVSALGGTLMVETHVQGGFQIDVVLPLMLGQ